MPRPPCSGPKRPREKFLYLEELQFQAINRQTFDTSIGAPVGKPRSPEGGETGFKDTIVAYPGEVTRIKARFESPGRFVWHCHILEHEDNEMMRPIVVSG